MSSFAVCAVTFILLAAVVPRAHAQAVRGQLTHSITRGPLQAAFLTLVDQQGVERARTITDPAGRYMLTAPAAGQYRLRSKMIGFRPYVSPLLTLSTAEALVFNVAIDPIPIALAEVVVAGERQCDVQVNDGAGIAALWEEVREALARVAWTSRSPGYWYEIEHFERELTASGRRTRRSDSTWVYRGYQQVPVRSAPAESLAATGYVVVGQDGWTYYGPDAEVLLSDPFLRTHCFETRVGRGETEGLVGLAFSPARGRSLPDVSGTLWLDRASAELRHLEFTYTRLPEQLQAPRAGGRLEFLRMPTGAWIVRDWVLTMPLAVRRGDALPEVTGFHESGERARTIKTVGGALVYADSTPPATPLAAEPVPPSPVPAPPAPVPAVAEAIAVQTVDRPRPSTRSRSGDILTAEDFASVSASDAYGVVQQLRPNWLRSRGPSSIQDASAGAVQLYVNGTRWGDVTRLREIPAIQILELRYRSGRDATMRYGMNHGDGVIEVTTR